MIRPIYTNYASRNDWKWIDTGSGRIVDGTTVWEIPLEPEHEYVYNILLEIPGMTGYPKNGYYVLDEYPDLMLYVEYTGYDSFFFRLYKQKERC